MTMFVQWDAFSSFVNDEMDAPDCFGEMCDAFTEWAAERGFFPVDDGVAFDPMRIGELFDMANAIDADHASWISGLELIDNQYRNPERELRDFPTFKLFGMESDDEGDFNGGYVIEGVRLLRAYCDAHGIAHT
jgi:hypothetical protein